MGIVLGDYVSFKGWSSVFMCTNVDLAGDSVLYVGRFRSVIGSF